MSDRGIGLENLVAFVERELVPKGFNVAQRKRTYNNDGVQTAEFDVEISGKLGTTQIKWLIECRDRPSEGPSPTSWIEQLVGRKERFNFNRVTAVSTTGFVDEAKNYALSKGIELRNVTSTDPVELVKWLNLTHLKFVERSANLEGVLLGLTEKQTDEQMDFIKKNFFGEISSETELRIAHSETRIPFHRIYLEAVRTAETLIAGETGLLPPPSAIPKKIIARYTSEDHYYVLDTPSGAVKVEEIIFTGKVVEVETDIPFSAITYKNLETGQVISEAATFLIENSNFSSSLEIHRIEGADKMQLLLRARKPDAA